MKLIVDIPEEKYEWLKKNNPNADTNSIVGAVVNGMPYEERPGEWIITREEQGAYGIIYTSRKCNRCGWASGLLIPRNFCPKCGIKMKREEMGDNR